MQKLAFITGATGFVGSAVARAAQAQGFRVRLLVRRNANRKNLMALGSDIESVEGDLTNVAAWQHALQGCDALFHVAADYRLWVPDPERMYATNVGATKALMEAAITAKVPRIVYTSSVAVLGCYTDGRVADEQTPVALTDMVGHYKRSKFLAEEEVRKLIQSQGLPCVIVNPSTPIGPGDIRPTPTGRIVIEAALGRMPAYINTGLSVSHVEDIAKGHLLALDKGRIGERYILGGENMYLGDILSIICELASRKPPKIRLPRHALWPVAFACELWGRASKTEPHVTVDSLRMARKIMFWTSAKAERELGYQVRSGREALHDALKWFREYGYC